MKIDDKTILESEKLIKELHDEESRDLSGEVKEIEAEILSLWGDFERERRLRHTTTAYDLRNKLETQYLKQTKVRSDQIKRVEEIKARVRILHGPFVDRWKKDLIEDHEELQRKKSIIREDDGKLFDKATGIPMREISHNLRDVSTHSTKILDVIKSLREGLDHSSIVTLEKLYLDGHKIVDTKLRTVKEITDIKGHEDLLASVKPEISHRDELWDFELSANVSAQKTIEVLENLKKIF